MGLLRLRFRQVDRAGHLTCNVQLATQEQSADDQWQISVFIRTEFGLAERFADQLLNVLATVGTEALLHGV